MRLATRPLTVLASAVLIGALLAGCGGDEIKLADVPPAPQPEPVPIDRAPKDQRPPRHASASARAAQRFDPAKHRGGPPR